MPQHFKNNGYYTAGFGKVFHRNIYPESWSQPFFAPRRNWRPANYSWLEVNEEDEENKPLIDQMIADKVVETLTKIQDNVTTRHQPFFLAVGFHLPHLPFYSPKRYVFWNYLDFLK